MYTKRIRDPDLIPALMAAGVQFGAVKARPELTCCSTLSIQPLRISALTHDRLPV